MVKWNLLSPSDCGEFLLTLFSLEVPPSEMSLYLRSWKFDLHIADDIFRKKWEEVEMFQGDLNTANVNPLLGALLCAHSHRLPCRRIPNTGRSTHRAHTRNLASRLHKAERSRRAALLNHRKPGV